MILFDDVDPHIYRKGNRKDNVILEFDWESIQAFVMEIYRSNEDAFNLEIHYGSSGLAVMTKLSELGSALQPPAKIKSRTRSVFYNIYIGALNLKSKVRQAIRKTE